MSQVMTQTKGKSVRRLKRCADDPRPRESYTVLSYERLRPGSGEEAAMMAAASVWIRHLQ